MFKVSLDANADALYVQLGEQRVHSSIEMDPGTLVDVDEDGAVVGIEVLRPARDWPLDQVLEQFTIGERERVLLGAMFGRRRPTSLEATYPSGVAVGAFRSSSAA